jgi:hypothetical protein
MPTNILAVITQEEFEPKLLPNNANPTMALQFLAPLLVPQFPENKTTQRTLFGRAAPPTHETVPVKDHFCGFIQVQFHMCRVKVKPNGETRKSPRPSTPRRRQENQNIVPFPKCKMTARRVFSWHALCTSRS